MPIFLCDLLGRPLAADEPLSFASGSWFDPGRNGQGFVVQVIGGGQAIVTWFTYPPAGEEAAQAWIIGTGTIDGNRIVIGEMLRPTGAVVGDRFVVVAGSDVAGGLSENRATQILEFNAD